MTFFGGTSPGSCLRKKAYRTMRQAKAAAQAYREAGGLPRSETCHAYICNVCHQYHVGRTP